MTLGKAAVAVLFNAPRAWFSRLLRTREVVKVLETNHAAFLATTPMNGWPLAIQQHQERIQAVRDGKLDIVDRRSWAFPYLPESLHRLNQPILKNCVSDDSQVLTDQGFLGLEAIEKLTREKTNFKVATLNPETHELQFVRPRKLFKYQYDGEMLHFRGRCFDLLVTPDHRMIGQFGWLEQTPNAPNGMFFDRQRFVSAKGVEFFLAQYRFGGFKLPFGADWVGEYPSNYNRRTGKIYLECRYKGDGKKFVSAQPFEVALKDYVAFLGIYLAEGSARGAMNLAGLVDRHSGRTFYVESIAAAADYSLEKVEEVCRGGGGGYYVEVAQVKSSRFYSEIQSLLRKFPFPWKPGEKSWGCSNKTLHSHLAVTGNSYTKYVPKWVKDLPPQYIRIFLDWYCKGDGIRRGRNVSLAEIKTTSPRMAEDLQELFLKAGRQARVKTFINRGGTDYWGHDASRGAPACYQIEENSGRFRCLPRPQRVPYKGIVWCLAVPPNETLFIRRNGFVAWTGNTPYNLRRFSETPIPRRAINLIKNAVASLRWDVQVTEESSAAKDPERDRRASIAKACLSRPNNTESWRTLIEAVTEDIIIGGYGCIEPRMTPNPKRPFKLWAVDGSTIRIFADWTEGAPDKPRYAQMTGLKGERGIIPFLHDELVYIKDNPRTSTPFGLGKLEVCFNTVNAFLGIQDMSSKAGADQIHKTWLWWKQPLAPGNHQLIQQHLYNEAEGQAKVSMVSGVPMPEVLDVRAVTSEDLLLDWQEFLIRILAAGFDLSPLSLGLERDVNRNTGQLMAQADFRAGVYPMAVRVQDHLTRDVLHSYMGWHDLRFLFLGLEDADPITRSGIERVKYQANAITPDEMREADGKPPLPGGWGKLTFGMMQIVTTIASARIQKQYGTAPKPFGGGASGQGQQPGASGGPPELGDGGSSPFASLAPQPSGIFSAADIARMRPNEIEMYRDSGMLPDDTETMMQQMEEEQPGILEALSEELREYFDAQLEKERAEKRKEAKARAKNAGVDGEQQKKFREREGSISEQERRFFDRGYSYVRHPNQTPRNRSGHT